MKSFFYKSIVIYFLIILILALISHYYIVNFISVNDQLFYSLYIFIFIIICSPIALIIIFKTNDKKIKDSITNLKRINKDLYESNERYDIVAKATSDTIWDWDIKTGGFIWNKGIQGVFGYKKEDVGENLQWWFEKIHPEDSLKMSVKLYSFIEQKTEKWQDYYRFMCADGTYKYVFDRGFLVMDDDRNVIRMIGAIQDITKQKE
jgi:PAS domain S-box-containing protein